MDGCTERGGVRKEGIEGGGTNLPPTSTLHQHNCILAENIQKNKLTLNVEVLKYRTKIQCIK